MICPKCKKEVEQLLALSRFSNESICSSCGNKEAFEVLYKAGIISKEDYDKKCSEVDVLWADLKE